MSTGNVELLHVRLKEELDRLRLKPAAAAKAAGETDSQGLRDVLGGRKRLTADLLSGLGGVGVDVYYVLTGQKAGMTTTLTAREADLVNNYRVAPEEGKRALETTSAALAQAVLPGGPPPGQKQINVGTNHGQVVEGGLVNHGPQHFGNVIKKK